MKSLLRHPVWILILRLVVGGIFLYASLDKIAHPWAFSRSVFAYEILPLPLVNLFTIVMPWIELIVGVTLILGIWPRASALILSGLTLSFLVAIPAVILRGIRIDCGCFSASGGDAVSWSLWARDLVLFAAAFWIVLAGEVAGPLRRLVRPAGLTPDR